jgi:hypothetical protein|tara:strand:- start:4475 stop:4690 length:216 start_codon:yes stop_codon:yes gene_type:complete
MLQIKLSEILSDSQIKKVIKILKTNKNEDRLSSLKSYFTEISDDLKKKGIHHEYLAWVIYARSEEIIKREL